MVVPIILMTLLFVMVGHGSDSTHPMMYIAIILTCPILSLVNFLSPILIYRANVSRLKNRETEFGRVLTTWNHRVFSDRKVAWKIGKYGCWLEIHFDKTIRNLESFNKEVLDNARSDLQAEYEQEAKLANINVDGQRVGLGSVGCCRPGVQGSSKTSADRKQNKTADSLENRQEGHAISVDSKDEANEDDDLEIKSISLGRPLLAPPT